MGFDGLTSRWTPLQNNTAMMGYFRLALSLIIMQGHSTPMSPHYVFSNTAVLVFYALSGYGCTAAMQSHYQGKPLLFLASRYIRLWPSYILVFGFSTWLMLWIEIPLAGIPARGWPLISNVLMLSYDAMPGAWVMSRLLLGYVVIAMGASATASRTNLWLMLSFVWSQSQALMLGWGAYYGSLAALSIAYSVGAASYWMGLALPRDKGLGKFAGEISFPVFLAHYPIVALVSVGFDIPLGWPLFFAALPPTLALSWLLVVAVERPIARYRKSLTKGKPSCQPE